MKKLVGAWRGFLLFICIPAFSQIDTTYIYNTSMPYGTLDIRIAKSATRYYYLQEDVTFSYRESSPGVKTNTFRDMTSWNSAPYREGNLREKNGSNDYFIMNYRFLLPNSYNPTFDPGYPIIIMLHGLGERGNCWDDNCYWGTTGWNPNTNNPPAPTSPTHGLLNNDHNLLHGGLKHLNAVNLAGSKLPDDPTLASNAFPGILVFPQNLNGWGSSVRVEDAIRLLRLMIKKYNVDENRVYIHGLSNGGGAVFQAIKRAPWLFAAALPMSAINDGSIVGNGLAAEVGKIPLWVFQGGQDLNPTPSKTYKTIKAFRDAGADVRYSLYPHLGHGTWNTAYNEKEFFPWMLSQRKNNPHIQYGNPVICNTTGAGVKLSFSNGFPAYQWEQDGVVISGANQSQYIANTPGSYRGRFSRMANPGENDWEPWSEAVVVTEISPAKPVVDAIGTTHLRGPGLSSTTENNTVRLRSAPEAEQYAWYKDGTQLDFPGTDVNDTLRMVSLTSASVSSNGAYTLVTSYSYCPSPPSDPVYLFFNNSASQNMVFNAPTADFKGVVISSGVFLTWNDIVNNEIGYEIWRKKEGTSEFKFAGRTGKDAISFYDGPLEPVTTYLYKIRAISKTGVSNYVPSNDLNINYSITTGGDQTPPSPPQQVKMTQNSTSSITLSWQASEDNTGIKEYIVSYGGNSVSTGTSATEFTIAGLPANTVYPVSVRAVDFAGHTSQPSNQIIASTYVLGLFYKHSTGAWVDLDDPTLTATWVNPEFTGTVNNFTLSPRTQEDFFNFQFTGYLDILTEGSYIFRLTSDDGSRLLMDGSVVVDNDGPHGSKPMLSDTIHLTQGPHPLEVQYFDYAGGQSLSLQYKGPDISGEFVAVPDSLLRSGKFIPAPPPSAPFNLQAVAAGMQQIDLSWQHESAGEFEVYRATSSTGTFAIIGRSGSTVYSDTTALQPGTTYYYKIKTISNSGTSGFTTIASATTTTDTVAPSVPGAPVLSNKTHTQVALTWEASTDNVAVTGYEVFTDGQFAGTTTIPAFTVTSLMPTSTYSFTVVAIDASGNRSASSGPLVVTTNPSAVYYSLATGALNTLATWKQNVNGTGSSPENFTENGQHFIVSNRTQSGIGGPWEISGSASKIIVPTGVTLTVDHPLVGQVELEGTASLNLDQEIIPDLLKLSPASTVNFNVASLIPKNSYGNISLTGTGIKTFDADTTLISGSLTISNGLTVKGAAANATTLVLNGNMTVNGTTGMPGADNRINFLFTENVSHVINAADDLYFYTLSTGENAVVDVQNSGTPLTIAAGSLNGGGLKLATGSVFNIGNNTFSLNSAGVINPENQTGRLAVAGGDLKLSSSSGSASNLYVHPDNNSVDTLLVDFTGAGDLIIREMLKISGTLKLRNGEINANGNVTLISDQTKSATISEIENGTISGDVSVQTYLAPCGDSWRDLSASVSDVTVADWQNYFPITGSFAGASTGPGLTDDPSLFISNESGLTPYPESGSSNQAPIQKGRGYITRINEPSAITLTVTGNPFQGNINFDLAGGSGANDGWNLIGNPYASSVVWGDDSEAWIASSINNTIVVRENKLIDNQSVSQYKYYNRMLGDAQIKSGEAFWVQAFSSSPSLTITEKAKGIVQDPYPQTDTALMHLIVTLEQGALNDPAYILFTDNATIGFDNQYDALKKENEGMFNLSSVAGEDINVAVNVLPDSFCTQTIRLNVQTAQPGEYAFTFESLSSLDGIGAVTLTDNFTGTVSAVSSSPYSFTVTAEPNSYGPDRFFLTLTRNPLDLVTPQLAAGTVCGQDSALVTILQSQSGVEYTAINESGEVISSTVEGGAASISLEIDKTKIDSGINHIRIRAGFKGCESQILVSEADLVYTPEFSIDVQEDVSVCRGEQAMLQVSGVPANGHYRWFDEHSIEIDSVQGNTLLTNPVQHETVFSVAGVSENGCESEIQSIHVFADSLETPMITLFNDTLFVQVQASYQWKKDGQIIAGANSPYYSPDEAGQYTVIAVNNGCSRESEVFFYGIDPDCQINTIAPMANAKNICGDTITIELSDSQPEVMYSALNTKDEVISATRPGNGETIILEVPSAALDSGINAIRIKAEVEGCETMILNSEITINHTPLVITTQETVIVCEGDVAVLKVSGVEGGHYVWYDKDGIEVEGGTDGEFTTEQITTETIMYVAGEHPGGCKTEMKKITITLPPAPVITSQNGVLTTESPGTYQWKKDGQIIAGATAPYYSPEEAGQYTVIVVNNGCPKESEVFFYGVDPDCQIDIITPVASVKDICGDTITIELSDSQAEVMYSALNMKGEVISATDPGNGETIILEVPSVALDSGANTVRIKATIEGCEPKILDSEITFNNTPLLITTQEAVIVCEGEVAVLKVSGMQGGHYVWYDADGNEVGSSAEFTTEQITTETIMYVSGEHPGGCKTERKKITITPLTEPVITSHDNVLSTQSPGAHQWKNNGEVIANATDSAYAPLTSGSYTVVVSYGDCSRESDPFEYSITDVRSGYSGEFVLNTFPVPATSDNFRISVQSPKHDRVVIQVIDLTGKAVFESGYNFNDVRYGVPVTPSSGHLSDGMYFIIATQGNSSVRKRVVIKN